MPRQQKKKKHVYHWKQDIAYILAGTVLIIAASSIIISNHSFVLFGRSISRLSTNEKIVALTFDDGPRSGHIDEVLSTLDSYHVKATFFLIGKEIDAHPDIARRIAAHGHQIGNHSYTHRSLVFTPYSTIAKEVELTDKSIRSIGYEGPIYFRPPYGHKFIALPFYLAIHDRETVLWNMAPDDLYKKADDMSNYIERSIKPGSIIVLHIMENHRSEQRKALKQFIPALQRQGYKFVTVQEMISRR
jgi:chitin deacetylase